MTINNLAQLKRAIKEGKEYIVVKHYRKPELSGTRRKPTKVQTNAYYTVVPGDPNHEVSRAKGGLGYYTRYGKASDWEFAGKFITQYINGNPIQVIMFA